MSEVVAVMVRDGKGGEISGDFTTKNESGLAGAQIFPWRHLRYFFSYRN